MKLKDDIYKKLQNLLTGSFKSNSSLEDLKSEDKQMKNEDELVNSFINQILDNTWIEEELKSTTTPSYYLSKEKKSYWLLNTTIKSLVNIKGGVELIPVEIGENSSICMIGYSMFSIPNELMIYAGWN